MTFAYSSSRSPTLERRRCRRRPCLNVDRQPDSALLYFGERRTREDDESHYNHTHPGNRNGRWVRPLIWTCGSRNQLPQPPASSNQSGYEPFRVRSRPNFLTVMAQVVALLQPRKASAAPLNPALRISAVSAQCADPYFVARRDWRERRADMPTAIIAAATDCSLRVSLRGRTPQVRTRSCSSVLLNRTSADALYKPRHVGG